MNNLGKKIKNLLEERNISQRDLSKGIGCSEVSISRYINGEREPRSDILAKIAEFFNVSMEYLIDKSESNKSNEKFNIKDNDLFVFDSKIAVDAFVKVYEKYANEITPDDLDEILKIVSQARKQNRKKNNNQDL